MLNWRHDGTVLRRVGGMHPNIALGKLVEALKEESAYQVLPAVLPPRLQAGTNLVAYFRAGQDRRLVFVSADLIPDKAVEIRQGEHPMMPLVYLDAQGEVLQVVPVFQTSMSGRKISPYAEARSLAALYAATLKS